MIKIKRLFRHTGTLLQTGRDERPFPDHFLWRLAEWIILLLDVLYLPEILMLCNRILKPNTRKLTQQEIALVQQIFKNNIDYQRVRIDQKSWCFCKQYQFAYVGFHFVNCWGPLYPPHFIHEMVHVWQYQREGSVYIPRALYAQRTAEGYDYGGFRAIERACALGKDLTAFNYEQQGDLIADYFCLLNGLTPRWCKADKRYIPYFKQLVEEGLYAPTIAQKTR